MKKKTERELKKNETHAVLDVRLVALDLAVDPGLQGVDEVVQGLVGRGVEGCLVEVVVGVFSSFFGTAGRGRGGGGGRRKASIACFNRLFNVRFCYFVSTSKMIQ